MNDPKQERPERPANAVDKQTEATITAADFAEPLNRNAAAGQAVDIVLEMTDKDGDHQVWRAEYSNAYGTGNNASRTRAQMAVDALASIGWKHGHDFSAFDSEMVGKAIPISVRWTFSESAGKWYKNVYLGHGGIRKMEKKAALDIIRALNGGAVSSPQPQPVPAAENLFAGPAAAPANPFAPRP